MCVSVQIGIALYKEMAACLGTAVGPTTHIDPGVPDAFPHLLAGAHFPIEHLWGDFVGFVGRNS